MSILDSIEQSLSPEKISIIEFAEDSRYCGKKLYPRQALLLKLLFLEELTNEEEDILTYWAQGGRNGTEITISPDVRERTEWLRENGYSHFREVILVGGRRSSKGFLTGLSMAYVMWNTLQLQDPGTYYGIDAEKDIQFSCIAGSEQQAKEFQYQDLSTTIESCRSFEPYLVKSLETEVRVATELDLRKIHQAKIQGNKIQKDIARLRGKALAANASTLRGSATMVYCIDEMAHMLPGESKASADQVYGAADPSLEQFGLDGMAFLNSSPYTKIGKFFEQYAAALLSFDPARPIDERPDLEGDGIEGEMVPNGDPRKFTLQYPSWALYEGYKKSKHKFQYVIMASPDWDIDEKDEDGEDIYSKEDKRRISQAISKENDNPDVYKVERRGKFAEVTDAFLNPAKVDAMYKGVPHEWVIDPDGRKKLSYIPLVTNWGEEISNLHRYKFHVDPSSTTAGFGFAIAHIEYFPVSFEEQERVEEHVVFDLIKRWMPKEFVGEVIKWEPILVELMNYAEMFMPFEITMDQHQSAEPMQDLQERLMARNINTRVYEKYSTNELNWKRWEVFKTVLYQGRLHAPFDTADSKFSAQELKFLQENRTGGKYPKVDRQEIGPVQTKDMADCMAECAFSLIGNMMVNRTRERLSNTSLVGGAVGGYGLGYSGKPQGGMGPEHISEYYSRRDVKEARSYQNPARGIVSRGRGRSGGHNRARW